MIRLQQLCVIKQLALAKLQVYPSPLEPLIRRPAAKLAKEPWYVGYKHQIAPHRGK